MHQFLCLLRRNCTPAALDNHSWIIKHPTVIALVEAQFWKRGAHLRQDPDYLKLWVRGIDGVCPRVVAPASLNLEVPTLHCLCPHHSKIWDSFSKYITWKKFQRKLFQFNKVTNSWKQDLTMGHTTGVQPAPLPTGAHHCSVLGSGLLSLFSPHKWQYLVSCKTVVQTQNKQIN